MHSVQLYPMACTFWVDGVGFRSALLPGREICPVTCSYPCGNAADMSAVMAASWGASLQLHYGVEAAGQRGRECMLRTFPLLSHHYHRPRPCRSLIIRASSKRTSSKKKTKILQDKSIPATSNVVKQINEPGLKRITDSADDIAFLSSREDVDGETLLVSGVNTSDASVASTREVVLKACVTTCAAIFMVGLLIQQATHLAAESGWSVPDSMILVKYNIESWDLKVICSLVLSVSISRQLLLLTWPEFLNSSEIANKEVLGPLQPIDYAIVAALPAISEELLFRGALLPLCGLDWKGITATGLLFGVLHLTGGRKKAFAIWASIVGLLYGLACVATGNVLVPMVAHGANNLIGATIWRLKQEDSSLRS